MQKEAIQGHQWIQPTGPATAAVAVIPSARPLRQISYTTSEFIDYDNTYRSTKSISRMMNAGARATPAAPAALAASCLMTVTVFTTLLTRAKTNSVLPVSSVEALVAVHRCSRIPWLRRTRLQVSPGDCGLSIWPPSAVASCEDPNYIPFPHRCHLVPNEFRTSPRTRHPNLVGCFHVANRKKILKSYVKIG